MKLLLGVEMFKGKKLLITGGTGSFGNAVLKRLIDFGIDEIRIFSRDEKKQDDMRRLYKQDNISFCIGDVRELSSVMGAMKGIDYVFHAAALKQVPSCEFYPLEAVKTNILGTENVLEAAVISGVSRVVCLSTDKAVYPINAMGISKAMMEKVVLAKSRIANSTVITCTRYGNVMASRGSVIPLFIDQISSGRSLTLTDPMMTRFMMTLEDAVDLVLHAFEHGLAGDIFVQKAPAATIATLAESLAKLMGVPNQRIEVIGTRHGEKLYEVLLSREEMAASNDLGRYYRIPPDLRSLNYAKFYEEGEKEITNSIEYTSHNTTRLNVNEMSSLLLQLPLIQQICKGTLG